MNKNFVQTSLLLVLLLVILAYVGLRMIGNNPAPFLAIVQPPTEPFDPTQFKPYRALAPFSPIVAPPYVTAEDANPQLNPNELVLGVEVDGHSRAYPINMLTSPSREIFNDQLGDQFIAATW